MPITVSEIDTDSIFNTDSLVNDSFQATTQDTIVQTVPVVPARRTNVVIADIFPADTLLVDTLAVDTLCVDTLAVDTATVETKTGFEGIPLPQTSSYESWLGVVLILFVFLLARSKKIIQDSVKTLFSLRERTNLFAEPTARDIQNWIYMLLVAGIGFSFFVYELTFGAYIDVFSIGDFLLTALGIIVFFLFKYFSFLFFGNIFFDKTTTRNWLKSYFTLFFLCGIALFPIAVLLIYNIDILVKIPIIIGIVLIGITLILMLYKLIQIFFHKGYSIFYLLLYLCALEIMPILVLWKALISN